MNKKSYLLILAIAILTSLNIAAQNHFYDSKRNIIGITGHHNELFQGSYGKNFFINDLQTELPSVLITKQTINHGTVAKRYDAKATVAALNKKEIGKRILDMLFQRSADGKLSEDMLRQRAVINAQRNDVERAGIGVIDASTILQEDYLPILTNNYIFLCARAGEAKTKWAWIVLHVDITEQTMRDVFAAWNNPAAYDKIKVPVSLVASGVSKIKASYNSLLRDISKKVDVFAIRGQVLSNSPLIAEVGSDAGIKNTDRFFIYRQKQNSKGEVSSKRVSIVRSHVMNDSTSRMFTIAGGSASFKKGDIAVFHPDVCFAHNLYRSTLGHTSSWGYLFESFGNMSASGATSHFLFKIAFTTFDGARNSLYEIGNTFDRKILYCSPELFNMAMGYGRGFQFGHVFQVMPYGLVQWDLFAFSPKNDDERGGYSVNGVSIPLGLKMNVNLYYPLQLTGGVEYTLRFNKRIKEVFYEPRGWTPSVLTASIGLRICM